MYSTKKNHWLLPNQICIAKGDAVANNLMFETKKDHQIFLKLWDLYLGEMTELINYRLSPHNWILLFKTKSEEDIKIAYNNLRNKSKKVNRGLDLHEPKRMLSEHIRIFLSQYVKRTNALHGRKGTKVLERFRKYIIRQQNELQEVFEMLTHQATKKAQHLKKYQADEKKYDIQKEMTENSIWREGSSVYKGILDMEMILNSGVGLSPLKPILRKFKIPLHLPLKPPKSP